MCLSALFVFSFDLQQQIAVVGVIVDMTVVSPAKAGVAVLVEDKKGKPEYKEGYNTFHPADLSNEMLDDFKVILYEYRAALNIQPTK